MSSIIQSIDRTRELLDFPKSQKPTDDQLYRATVRNFQQMYNRVANTGEAWSIGEKIVATNGSDDTFTISSEDSIGKILYISRITGGIETPVDFTDVQDLTFDWKQPEQQGWFAFAPQNAQKERVALLIDAGGSLKMQILPRPSASVQYRVRYSLGNWADKLSLEARPILAQFHQLFEIRSAKDALYMSEWEGLTREENIEKRREIKPYLDEQEARFERDFEIYIREMTADRIVFKRTWE